MNTKYKMTVATKREVHQANDCDTVKDWRQAFKIIEKYDITFGNIVNPDICMLHAEMNV